MPTTRRVYAPNRIRELRNERDISLEEIASRISEDVATATIHKLERRQMGLTLDWMIQIGNAIGVPPEELIRPGGARMLPVAGQIAAGDWTEAVAEPDGWVPVEPSVAGPRAFALRPRGDSMDKVVQEGGYIVVDPDDTTLSNGKLYAIQNGEGEATFKRFCADPPRLEPCSNNPEHRAIAIGKEPFVVIGRVTFVGQPT